MKTTTLLPPRALIIGEVESPGELVAALKAAAIVRTSETCPRCGDLIPRSQHGVCRCDTEAQDWRRGAA